MRPKALLHRILSDENLRSCYYDVKRIYRSDRPILEAICAKIAYAAVPGVYAPDRLFDGPASLLERIVQWAEAFGDEESVAAGLHRLSGYGFIEVTEKGCLLIPAVVKSQATSSAINGRTSPGRPRMGESREDYRTRAAVHREEMLAQVHLPSAASKLGLAFGDCVTGKDLTRALHMTPSTYHQQDISTVSTRNYEALVEPSVSSSASMQNAIEHKGDTGVTALASAMPARALTEAASPAAGSQTLEMEMSQITNVSSEADDLAKSEANRWNWSNRHREEAPRYFQVYFDRGYSAEMVHSTVKKNTRRCSSASVYAQDFPVMGS